MRGNLKTLGLALVAALALSAFGASGAMAEVEEHEFVSEVEPTVIKGTGTNHKFTIDKGSVFFECKEVHFEGTLTPKTTDDVTVGFHYTGNGAENKCDSSSGKENTIVKDAECHYLLDSDTTEGNSTSGETMTEKTHANVTLTCPGGHLIVDGTLDITVKDQVIEDAVHYDNEGADKTRDVKVTATAAGIEWKCISSAFVCNLGLGGTTEGNDGTYTGNVTAQGFKWAEGNTSEVPGSYVTGEQVGIWVE